MNLHMCLSTVALGALVAFAAVSCGKSPVEAGGERVDTPNPTARQILSLDDKNFLIRAEKTEFRQKALAMTALEKSENTDVREFARNVIDDRKRALDDLMDLMKRRDVTDAPAIAEEIQLEASHRLDGVSDGAFDHEFLSLMTAEQQQAIESF